MNLDQMTTEQLHAEADRLHAVRVASYPQWLAGGVAGDARSIKEWEDNSIMIQRVSAELYIRAAADSDERRFAAWVDRYYLARAV